MADNTKPAGNLPDWAYDDGGNNTAPNPALGADDITEPGAPKKVLGWEEGDIPPRNWWNWITHKVGAWLRWLAYLGDSYKEQHHDHLTEDVDGVTMSGFHSLIQQRDELGLDDRVLVRAISVPQSVSTIKQHEYFDNGGTIGAGYWIVINAIWTGTEWDQTVAGQPSAATYIGAGQIKHLYQVAGAANWADNAWLSVAEFSKSGTAHNDWGAMAVKGTLINYPNGAHGSGDHIGGGVGELAAAVTSGFWFPPQLENDAEPSGVPVNTTALGRMAWVVEQEKLRQFWRNASGWIDRPIVPISARYISSAPVPVAGTATAQPIYFATKQFDEPGADKMLGHNFNVTASSIADQYITVTGSHVADFPKDSHFCVTDSTGVPNNDGWYTVNVAIPDGGNTKIFTNEAVDSNAGDGYVHNSRFIPGHLGRYAVYLNITWSHDAGGGAFTTDLSIWNGKAAGVALDGEILRLDANSTSADTYTVSGSTIVEVTEAGQEIFVCGLTATTTAPIIIRIAIHEV